MENNNKLRIGEHFTYKNRDWICLDYIDGNILAITSEVYQEIPFDTENRNDWRKSSVRRVLNGDFLEGNLNKKYLIPMKLDLTADNGDKSYGECEDYVGILACDQYRKYRDIVPLFEEWMWTCTPWNCRTPNSSGADRVRGVIPTGAISDCVANYSYGVVPACIFSSANLKLCRQAHLVGVDEDDE